ncbi:glycosyltransferase family 2 protein [Cochleicola gelatinilyticus]|uniref:Glycosyl transferase family 2 n=1 Tax=Cochleicola gelatinilyticus TaxID=1763537 RepID=A0A167K9Q4_9FLAO|nr:glycosyltransferase family 2 protein [Cochleicola gelatinilyticus]OAB81537.1 glycosyl transferase family 2 [Cochleicola gelatinilyticus]
MKVSIVILNYNVRYFLEQCIRSVERAITSIDAEIIVIDNNSEDDSCAMVKQLFPKVRLIENKENVGFSKANNQAVAVAKGEYVCILNPDTAVGENTFLNCIKYAESINRIGILGVSLLDGTGNFLPESKRNIPTPKASFFKMVGLKKWYYANHLNQQDSGEVSVLAGAFMFMKRAVYKEVNGFDEAYFMYGEDIDLSYKVIKAGYFNHYLGTTDTLHYKGESTEKDLVYLNRFYGAMRIFYKKHFKTNTFLDVSVTLGVILAKLKKQFSFKVRKKRASETKHAYVLTENLNFYGKLSEVMNISLKSASKQIFDDGSLHNTLFIFDAEYMPYEQIFSVMNKLKNRNNTFRIRPPHCNFILGSDASDDRGTVVCFGD